MDPPPESDDRRLRVQLALETAIAEALRRREVVRWGMLAFGLLVAVVIAAVIVFAAFP